MPDESSVTADESNTQEDEQFKNLESVEEDNHRQRAYTVGRSGFLGLFLAASVMLAYNSIHFLLNTRDFISATARAPDTLQLPFYWFFDYELGAAEAVAVVIGLAATVATLSVAVVASAWRPGNLEPHVERHVEHWIAGMKLAMLDASGFSVAAALLIDHTKVALGTLLLGVAFVTARVSTWAVTRESQLSFKVERYNRRVTLQKACRALHAERHQGPPGSRRELSTSEVRRGWFSLFLAPLLATAVVLVVILIISGGFSQLHENLSGLVGATGQWLLVSLVVTLWQQVAILAVFGTRTLWQQVAMLAVFGTRTVADERPAGHVLRWVGNTAGVLLMGMTFSFAALAGSNQSITGRLLHISTVLIPTIVTVTLVWLGRKGRGPGVVAWSIHLRALEFSHRIAEEKLRALSVQEALRTQSLNTEPPETTLASERDSSPAASARCRVLRRILRTHQHPRA